MRGWLFRLFGLLYVFALVWLSLYIFWTLSDEGVEGSGWINQFEAFSLFVLLVLLGVVVGLVARKPLISRLLLIFFVCACTVLTYADTSWNLFDATTRREYSIFRGHLRVSNNWISPATSRFDFITNTHERSSDFDRVDYDVRFSLWIIVGFLALLCLSPELVGAFQRVRQSRLAARGFCTKCGYDLKGLTERRCPECGTAY